MRRRSARHWLRFAASGVGLTFLALSSLAQDSRQELEDALRARPNLERGARHFETCAACHEPSGGGRYDDLVPRIAGQHREVLIEQLIQFRYAQRWDVRMEPLADQHVLQDAQAVADVAAHVSRLSPLQTTGLGSGELVEHGARIYSRLCRSCHGRVGEGSARKRIPQLAGQHYEYLLRQMYDAVEGRRPSFPREHVEQFEEFELDDYRGVADYLSRLSVDPSDRR